MKTTHWITVPRLIFLTLFGVGVLIMVTNLVSCSAVPNQYRPFRPIDQDTLPSKEVQKYRALTGRYQYDLYKVWLEGGGFKMWQFTLEGTCIRPDEGLPSRPFVAVDYGRNGMGFDKFQFTDGKPSLPQERQWLPVQVRDAFSITYKKENLLWTRRN